MAKSDFITKARLRLEVHRHLVDSGFSRNGHRYYIKGELTKQRLRDLHLQKRVERLEKNRNFILKRGTALLKYIANGNEIDPAAIQPELVEVKSETRESDLFRFASLLWSVPVSEGCGRRIRFLVKDKLNDKLIGIFAW